jgi:hypothetical protein
MDEYQVHAPFLCCRGGIASFVKISKLNAQYQGVYSKRIHFGVVLGPHACGLQDGDAGVVVRQSPCRTRPPHRVILRFNSGSISSSRGNLRSFSEIEVTGRGQVTASLGSLYLKPPSALGV